MKMMRKHFFICAITILIWSNSTNSQEGIHQGQLTNPIPENFITASPDVAAFQKFNTLPVSLYTGKIDLTIPIFEIKSGNIVVPISISYNSGGIKIDDFASSVGTNWNLNAGGSIIRMIKDLPDNEVSYSLFAESDWDVGLLLNPSLHAYGYNRKTAVPMQNSSLFGVNNNQRHATYIESDTYNETKANIDRQPTYQDPQKDLSPDIFNINAPGISSKFTAINTSSNAIYPNNNNGFTTTFLDGNGAKMEYLIVDRRNINGEGFGVNHSGRIYTALKDFFEFNIINNNGIKYKFGEEEVSESFNSPLGTKPIGGSFSANSTWATMISNNYNKRIHTWNLANIFDPSSNKKVLFNYETYSNKNTVANTYIQTTKRISGGPSSFNQNASNSCTFKHNPVTAYNYSGTHTNLEKHPKRKRLTKIIYDKGEVNFIYGKNRLDYMGEKALTEIQITDIHGAIIKKVRFNYSYFIAKENCSEAKCKRLKLDRIDVFGNDSGFNSYTFDYEYTNKLPKRGSLQQDYLGFYNNNGVSGNSSGATTITPKLYHYANQGRYTILPFQKSNASHELISGQIDFTPNNYSLTGLLKKITYPTGGSSEFEFENNTFQFEGATYIAPGARIKSQILKENNLEVRKIEYEYQEKNGVTSGYINNIPIYGYVERFLKSPYSAYEASVFDKPKGGIELSTGSFVAYSRVLEKELNNGYTEYIFSSPKTIPNTPEVRVATTKNKSWKDKESVSCSQNFIANSAYPSSTFIDNDYKRGKLIHKKIYDKANNLLAEESIKYTPRTLSTLDLQKNFKIQARFPSDAVNAWDEGRLHILDVSSSIPVAQDLETQRIKTEYFGGKAMAINKQTIYDIKYPFPIETKWTSGKDIFINKYYYPNSTAVNSCEYMGDLRRANRLSEVVKFEKLKGSQNLSTQQLNYQSFTNGLILPKSISTSKGLNKLSAKETINKRDLKGNIIEIKSESGKYKTFIYGYNHSSLIAKIDDASFTEVERAIASITSSYNSLIKIQELSNLDNDRTTDLKNTAGEVTNYIGKEGNLRKALNDLRNSLPNAQVTTYTYDPLVGITSITDPRGQTTYYHYDAFNRLQYVKDNQGNVLSENQYHYKN